jgi:site-specific DNA recombinase
VALLYRRVSSDDQAREGLSLGAQAGATRRYAAQRGWAIAREYEDVLTGMRPDRPGYQALLGEARRLRRTGQAVAVVVARLDRVGRAVLERARCAEELRKLGVPIHSASEGGQLPELVEHLLAAVAQEEVRRLGERLVAARAFVAANGWHYPMRPAWGYARRPATAQERAQGAPHSVLVVDPRTARYVRELWRRVEAGEPVSSVVRWVHGLRPAARGGRRLTYRGVRVLLGRPVYVARPAGGDPDVLARPAMRWPALVSDERWRRVQARLGERPASRERSVRRHLLAGLLRCPGCGAPMGGTRNLTTTVRGYPRGPRYRCTGRNLGAGASTTCYASAAMSAVDGQVVALVGGLLERALSAGRRGADGPGRARPPSLPDQEPGHALDDTAAGCPAAAARQRWTRAALRLVDGTIGKAAYERLRDQVTGHPPGAPGRRSPVDAGAVGADRPNGTDVPGLARAWEQAIEAGDVPAQRAVLAALIVRVVPVRVRHGEYRVDIDWTPLGLALQRVGGGGVGDRPA